MGVLMSANLGTEPHILETNRGVTTSPQLHGSLAEHWGEATVNEVNAYVRYRICPVHKEPLLASFSEGRWECPHDDVVMPLEANSMEASLMSLGIAVTETDGPSHPLIIFDSLYFPSGTRVFFPGHFNAKWVNLSLVLLIATAIGFLFLDPSNWVFYTVVIGGTCGLGAFMLLDNYRRRAHIASGMVTNVPFGFVLNSALPDELKSPDDLVGVPGLPACVPRQDADPFLKNYDGVVCAPPLASLVAMHARFVAQQRHHD